jgi:hypothetical protein
MATRVQHYEKFGNTSVAWFQHKHNILDIDIVLWQYKHNTNGTKTQRNYIAFKQQNQDEKTLLTDKMDK